VTEETALRGRFSAGAWRGLPSPLRRLTTVLSLLVVLAIVLAALFAPWLAPHDYAAQELSARLDPPGPGHPLGRDEFGRDVLSRLIFGARVSLLVAVLVVSVELAIGLTLGMLAGYSGGRLDAAVSRVTDVMFAFPDILLAILITGVLGKNLLNVFLALAVVGWPSMVRLVRAQTLGVTAREFVAAARVQGASTAHILRKHILPNILGPVIAAAAVGMGAVVLAESTLSFLGLGIQEPFPSWGSMINHAWKFRRSNPMLTVYPSVCLAATIMAFNFLGDALRDWLDPRSRRV